MRYDKKERRRLVQAERLAKLSDDELHEVGRELYWRAEQFGPEIRQIVNDELRKRGMQTVSASADEDLGYTS